MITEDGDYLSNLKAPDLRPYFKHLHWRKMPHSMGHLVASDWADKAVDDPVFGLYKNCGLWTRDEAAILYECARRCGGSWVDIGSHVGWTTAHIFKAGGENYTVQMVDPLYGVEDILIRMYDNVFVEGAARGPWGKGAELSVPVAETSQTFFDPEFGFGKKRDGTRLLPMLFNGVCIDGDHEPGKPLEDAQNAAKHLADTGVILFHDFLGQPVREAVTWLMDQGFKARVYWTPHVVACCWRGDFTPPEHDADPRIDWSAHKAEMWRDFDFGRLS